MLTPVAQRHLDSLRAAADAGAHGRGRVGAVAAVNDLLWRPATVAVSLYTGEGRTMLLRALNEEAQRRGWAPVADHELHDAPSDGILADAVPGPSAERPDPWTWTTAHAVSTTRCRAAGGAQHRIVFDRGEITYPDHPGGADSPCWSPHARAASAAYWAGRAVRFDHGWFAERGRTSVAYTAVDPWEGDELYLDDDIREHHDTKANQFYAAGVDEGVCLPQDPLLVHDPTRPDLTTVTGRRTPGPPDGAWWDAPGTLTIQLCLSTWWPLEVARQPWKRVGGLLALDVLQWDTPRNLPYEMLLLEWCEDPAAQLHRSSDRTGWITELGLPLAPALVRVLVTQDRTGAWAVRERLDRTVVTGCP